MDRSATSVILGFLFQANAAIVLMLENMKELKSIRLECNEDIDIELNDGTYVLAQAKCVEKSSTDFANVRANAKKAMDSLSDGSHRVSAKEVIYITNSPDPFKESLSKNMFYGPSVVKYDELPSITQGLISDYLSQISQPLDKSKLTIRVLPFEGDDERQRYKVVWNAISDFLDDLGLNESGFRKKLHNVWEGMLYRSGSKADKDITLGKKDIVWPIIVCVTGHDVLDRDAQYCMGLDDGVFEEIKSRYSEIIDYCSERYELVAKIIADYSLIKRNDRDSIGGFINDHWSDYIDNFGLDSIDESIRCSLIKIILYRILVKRYAIDRIKKGVNL